MYEREAKFAGHFYESSKAELIKQIEDCFLRMEFSPKKLPSVDKKAKRRIIGLIVPHAGYIYSGSIAANSYFHLALDGKPESIIIIGPNHTGFGTSISIMKNGVWKTPLGKVKIDEELAEEIIEASKIAMSDVSAHIYEHSIEVQLPFLQYAYKDFENLKFVPICMLDQNYEACIDLGNAISKIAKDKNKDIVVIASSDFTHFENNETAHEKDKKALDVIKKLDAKKFLELVFSENLSICGYGPIASMLIASRKLNAKKCEIINYATSGDVTGNIYNVVGYASVKVIK
jgi:hypothetical protein